MKKIKVLLFLAIGALSSVSCVDDDVASDGYKTSPFIVGFSTANRNVSYVTNGDIVDLDVPVILLGTPQGIPMETTVAISYEIDAATTATVGTQFDLVNTTTTVEIPTGGTTVSIPLKIYTGNFEPGAENAKKIVLKITSITSTGDVVVGKQWEKITINIAGLCFSNLAGAYTVNYTSGSFPVTITEIGPGTYHSDTVMGWTPGTYEMTFSDVCDTLSFIDWSFQESNPISGGGTVLGNGNISWIGVTIAGVYENRNYTFVKN